ncbi:flavin reductase (DIM6/NTAB) family NADH-FMN oxidoreductase RutF [Leucobacter exalbidus]|uniref:Flavin reductase (DIM6/NTAB) family NADH-FMN oxidoreductase RutF n=1 Tax=Leucobacter exalbidus TaxID=662960 RepID=A0A940PVF0_9MICO|nr:flavin reductase family protein [Leucobacter exalbidus]MBP1326945.1 flavin reductase (DIM6/NTAB) family NADH-FMN oxidoreductase RutF [Leucobacter exalbidus]
MSPKRNDIGEFQEGSKLYHPPQHHFRGSLGRFATGVAVVTFIGPEGERRGITINSFTSISMDPPLVLASIGTQARSHEDLKGRPFTVNILGAQQQALASEFAGRPGSAEPTWIEGEHAPRLGGTISWFECTPWAEYPGGDHTMFLGEVQNYDYSRGDALGFVGGQFTTISELAGGQEELF